MKPKVMGDERTSMTLYRYTHSTMDREAEIAAQRAS
jgi:hypothetical protein